jgi:hypothetical protein
MSDFWWTADDQLFAKYYNSLKYSIVADLVATLPVSDELHSPLKDVEKSYTHYQTPNYPAAVGRLLQAIRKIYNYFEGGGMQFVDRGDPAAWDFEVGDFTTDGAWHDLDLSGIIPAGVSMVQINITFSDDNPGSWILFRKKGNVNEFNMDVARSQVTDVINDACVMVQPDINGIIQYKTFSTAFTIINLVVRGWLT